jgi:hypothetical protein
MVRDKCEGRLAGIRKSDITTPPALYITMNAQITNSAYKLISIDKTKAALLAAGAKVPDFSFSPLCIQRERLVEICIRVGVQPIAIK